MLGAIEAGPAEPQEEREKFNTCGPLSVCDISGIPLDVLSVCDNSDLPSGESGNLLNMIMDSGAEETRGVVGRLGKSGVSHC